MLVTELIDGKDVGGATSIRIAPRSLASELVDFADIPEAAWSDLAKRAVEPNLFYEPLWFRAVARNARRYRSAQALLTWDDHRKKTLIGLLPVRRAWSALRLPVPLLVAAQPYVPLCTPLLDREMPEAAAHGLMDAARAADMAALLMPLQTLDGAAFQAFRRAAEARGIPLTVWNRRHRARLNTVSDADALLLDSLGAKKIKELRRQRNRLADLGEVRFSVARNPAEVMPALERFLQLEASGWKGRRGTALAQDRGDAAFIREAARGLSGKGQFEVMTLTAGGRLVASCLVIRNKKRAHFFKLAYDECEAKTSPGVQLTLELTRYLCADGAVEEIDSTAEANHPMIDHIWLDRLALGDVFVPLMHDKFKTGAIARLVRVRDMMRNRARSVVHGLRALGEK